MSGMETIQTPRMTAERLRADQYAAIHRMYTDPRVMATLGGVRSDAEIAQLHQANLDRWERDDVVPNKVLQP